MAGLTSLLYTGASGLRTSQNAIRTASDNIANVSTPGFKRREHIQTSMVSEVQSGFSIGSGVETLGIRRSVDATLERRVRSAQSELAFSQARTDALRNAEALVGDLTNLGPEVALDGLFSAFDQLAESPHDTGSRLRVLDAAETFATSVNDAVSNVQGIQTEADRQLEADISRVNELTAELASLNHHLGRFSEPPLDLLDRRDQALTELSQLVGINVIETGNRVQVSLQGSGFGLVMDEVQQELSFSAATGTAVVTGDRNGNVVDLTESLGQGRVGGALQARNVDLASLVNELDTFAFDVANAINGVHAVGFGTDGVGARNLFDVPATSPGSALALQVHADVDGQPDRVAAATDALLVPGDNRNAIALAELRTTTLTGGGTPGETLRLSLTEFGTRLSASSASVDAQEAVAANLEDLQSAISGVSLDEEMAKLLEFRQAYAAAARVVRTADELMQEVIGLKR